MMANQSCSKLMSESGRVSKVGKKVFGVKKAWQRYRERNIRGGGGEEEGEGKSVACLGLYSRMNREVPV